MTTTVLNIKINEVENEVPDPNSFVTTTLLNTEIGEVENKVSDYVKYITIQEINKLTGENFATRLTQANLVSKIYFDNKLIIFLVRNKGVIHVLTNIVFFACENQVDNLPLVL